MKTDVPGWFIVGAIAIVVAASFVLERSQRQARYRDEFQKSVESAEIFASRSTRCADGEISFDVVFPPKGATGMEPVIFINGRRMMLGELRQIVIGGALGGKMLVSRHQLHEVTGRPESGPGEEIMTCPPPFRAMR